MCCCVACGRTVDIQKFLAGGGHSTVRVIVYEVDRVAELRSKLSGLGCATELSNVPSFFSVDVPADVDFSGVVNFLECFAGQGVWTMKRHPFSIK